MKSREHLKSLLLVQAEFDVAMDKAVNSYIHEEAEHLIYVTDHALVRYGERILDITPVKDKSDLANVDYMFGPKATAVRASLLTREEQEFILRKGLKNFDKEGLSFVIKNLAVITVFKRNYGKTNKSTEAHS